MKGIPLSQGLCALRAPAWNTASAGILGSQVLKTRNVLVPSRLSGIGNPSFRISGRDVGRSSLGLRSVATDVEGLLRSQAVKGSKKLFVYNLRTRLAKENEALGMERMYVERVESTFESIWQRHQQLITDERSVYHVQAACLVLASYRVLTEQLQMDKHRAIDILRQVRSDV